MCLVSDNMLSTLGVHCSIQNCCQGTVWYWGENWLYNNVRWIIQNVTICPCVLGRWDDGLGSGYLLYTTCHVSNSCWTWGESYQQELNLFFIKTIFIFLHFLQECQTFCVKKIYKSKLHVGSTKNDKIFSSKLSSSSVFAFLLFLLPGGNIKLKLFPTFWLRFDTRLLLFPKLMLAYIT